MNWCSVFIHAHTYSTNYLLFTLTVAVASVIAVWVYEKPQLYKLIFKISKHSNAMSPVQSETAVVDEMQANAADIAARDVLKQK